MLGMVMALWGCVGELDWEPIEREDLGSVRLVTDGARGDPSDVPQDFDAQTNVVAVVGRCFSSSCARQLAAGIERLPTTADTVHLRSTWRW
ncbi:MAG: hypothetical protein AAF602_30000, partial [Myxococcota bacterium]